MKYPLLAPMAPAAAREIPHEFRARAGGHSWSCRRIQSFHR